MFRDLYHLFKAVPITWLMLFASGLLWAADNALAERLKIKYHEAQCILGAESQFDLWDGAWWTVLSTALHHGDVVHLLCNTIGLWWLGRLLETRMGSWRYALFCLSATAVSGGIQSLWSPYVGLSGMLYAQFGLIWAWRKTDTWLQTYVRDEHIQWGLIWLFLCLPLTWLNLLQVGNAAHFSGCLYGYVTGVVYFGSLRVRSWKPVFLVAHACLIPMFYFLVHPSWNGNYHWRRGDVAVSPIVRERHYRNAIACDPDLDGPWVNLTLIYLEEGRPHDAWEWILRGLQHHPSYGKAIDLARRIWVEFPNRFEREFARKKLREIFGESAPQWEKTLLAEAAPDELPAPKRPRRQLTNSREEEPGQIEVPEVPFVLPRRALDEIIRSPKKMPAPNPNTPGSAEEGRRA